MTELSGLWHEEEHNYDTTFGAFGVKCSVLVTKSSEDGFCNKTATQWIHEQQPTRDLSPSLPIVMYAVKA